MAEHVYDSSDSCTGKSAVQEPAGIFHLWFVKKISNYNYNSGVRHGWMIASTLINVPGISEFFTEGYVTYSNEAKVKMIHVAPETIDTYGVVSSETAADMAASAAKTAATMAAVSVTGVAGPDGGTKECPVGLVFIGCYLNGKTVTERHMFSGSRMDVRKSATESALSLLKKCIEETYAV